MTPLPRVGFDIRGLQHGFKSHHGRGIGRYVRSLLEAMLPMDAERRIGFVADTDGELDGIGRGGADRLHRVDAPQWLGRLGTEAAHVRQHVYWPRALSALPFDLFHFCSQTDAPARLARPYVVTVLDLIPHRLPDLYRTGKNRARFLLGRWLERRALAGARGLIAISRYTADDCVRLLEIPRDRIAVTPLAVRSGLAPASATEVAAFCRRHRLRAGYLLYVGGIDRRKNIPFLLEVLRAIVAQRPDVELVVAGRYRDDPDFADLVARLQRLGLEDLVRLVGYIAEDELAPLYGGASVFVYPSVYEGFGLPPLEAMACGTPVVAADRTALPEVLGHAALLVDPTDVAEFAEAILSLLEHGTRRRELSEAGLRQARRFSWEATARATLEAYRQFAELPPPALAEEHPV
ncbi:MAG TPA: glycosyltransferase family 1 protein [Candidatus Binatia bacterium]|nr:glycosyltransferase family 1 protein [Candidatus Binatia bacterium]